MGYRIRYRKLLGDGHRAIPEIRDVGYLYEGPRERMTELTCGLDVRVRFEWIGVKQQSTSFYAYILDMPLFM